MVNNKLIVIKEEVKQKLDDLKLCPTETYNNVIQRLLENKG